MEQIDFSDMDLSEYMDYVKAKSPGLSEAEQAAAMQRRRVGRGIKD
jgi:hypothetical protein